VGTRHHWGADRAGYLGFLVGLGLDQQCALGRRLTRRNSLEWTADKSFSASSAYQAFFVERHAVPGAKLLRKTRAPPKCKFFIWLVLHDRCWTAQRRKRRNLQDDDSCALCNQLPESIAHLLLACPTSREVCFLALRRLNWQVVTPTAQTNDFPPWSS
jgi:hypothetical protein